MDEETDVDRDEPTQELDEVGMLEGWLDFHRATLLWKCAGLTREQLAATTAASSLTLAGLLKHLALNEWWWFNEVLLGADPHPAFADADWDGDADWEMSSALDDDPDELRALYDEVCVASREVVAAADSLDQHAVRPGRSGETFTLRWILSHMVEETARHNGHADLLRESVDGATG